MSTQSFNVNAKEQYAPIIRSVLSKMNARYTEQPIANDPPGIKFRITCESNVSHMIEEIPIYAHLYTAVFT